MKVRNYSIQGRSASIVLLPCRERDSQRAQAHPMQGEARNWRESNHEPFPAGEARNLMDVYLENGNERKIGGIANRTAVITVV